MPSPATSATRKPFDRRIDEIETCHDYNRRSYMIHLKDGWRLDNAHTFGEDTMRDIRRTMRFVKPCDCEFCRAAIAKAGA